GAPTPMNYPLVGKVLGLLLLLMAGAMGICEAHALIFDGVGPDHEWALLQSLLITGFAGAGLVWLGRGLGQEILRKEAIAVVGLGWLLCTLTGALPYMLCRPSLDPASAFFESASGFTTTGASAMTDIEKFPRSILLWRSTTQWLGGMGILVLFVALLSTLGTAGRNLLRHESSAQSGYGVHARVRQTAVRLWQIYIALTLLCIAGLALLGMSLFDAILHTFSAISTGGFSPKNASVGAYDSAAVDAWLCLFMLLGGCNFLLIASLLAGHPERVRRDEELRLYLTIVVVATGLVCLDLMSRQGVPFLHALRLASFQVISIMTTTGFATADFAAWPTLSMAVLVLLMFVGGCSGSTAGGIKVRRAAIFFKAAGQQVLNSFRPSQHVPVRLNGEILDAETINRALFFLALTAFCVALATLAITAIEPQLDLLSAFTAVAASLFNIGPGLGAVGPTQNYAFLHPASKITLSLLMVLGRLEFYGLLALCIPALWRRY
ncbi:MAG: TrkH family potassium uptake protein, partial [Terrimicrobiaceae bacterium]|nr:TrkH family potassium uptake protein [Terrimicrobiaceae bacterium]